MNSKSKLRTAFAIIVAASLAVGCGGGGANNDQGVAFQLTGFSAAPCTTDSNTGLGGVVMALTDGFAASDNPQSEVFICANITNNMTTQFVRTERIYVDYLIYGSSLQPPSITQPMPATVFPLGVNGIGGQAAGTQQGGQQVGGTGAIFPPTGAPGSTLPPSAGSAGGGAAGAGQLVQNRVVAPLAVVPASIRRWMNFNRANLPELPFQMEAVAFVCGTTSSGDEMCTNEQVIGVWVYDDQGPINPPGNFLSLEDGEMSSSLVSQDFAGEQIASDQSETL